MADLVEDLYDAEDLDVVTDDETEVPQMEVRVPAEWQSKMSTKALESAKPLPFDEVLTACAQAIESRVQAWSRPGSLPSHVWERLSQQHGGSHKLVEQALASLINGVEVWWTKHAAIQLFGELCGMLTADHSAVVTRRALTLLTAEGQHRRLVGENAIARTLVAEDGGTIDEDEALAALPRLRLTAELQASLEEDVRGSY